MRPIMAQPLADQIMAMIDQAVGLYCRLVLVVAPSAYGKTEALLQVSKRIGVPYLNVNLELSQLLLDLTERQRSLHTPRLFSEIIDKSDSQVVLLDNIEVLFDPSLKQDPLRLLQGISRNKTVVVAWSGSVDGGFLTYAKPDHPEYCRYPTRDLLIISPDLVT